MLISYSSAEEHHVARAEDDAPLLLALVQHGQVLGSQCLDPYFLEAGTFTSCTCLASRNQGFSNFHSD